MILVDTSVWIDHLHRKSSRLAAALEDSLVLTHPMIIGELALGTIANRTQVLTLLSSLPQPKLALHPEVMTMVNAHELHGLGLALVDAHLLASVRITAGASLWSHDKRLMRVATSMGVAYDV